MWKKIGLGILMIFGVIAAGYLFGKVIALTIMAMAVLFVINKKFVDSKFLNVCVVVAGLIAIGGNVWLKYSTEFPVTTDMLREQKTHLDIRNGQKGFVPGNEQDKAVLGFAYRLDKYQSDRMLAQLDTLEERMALGIATHADTARVDTLLAQLQYSKEYTKRIANGQSGLGTPKPKLVSVGNVSTKDTVVIHFPQESTAEIEVPANTMVTLTVGPGTRYSPDMSADWMNRYWCDADGSGGRTPSNTGLLNGHHVPASNLPWYCGIWRWEDGTWQMLNMATAATALNDSPVPKKIIVSINEWHFDDNQGQFVTEYELTKANITKIP